MGYMHIDNLYKNRDIMMFRECYAMEKIHGTSAHVSWNNGKLGFFSGGESYDLFVRLFDIVALETAFRAGFGEDKKVIVYGEAYGGKCQGMRETYGDNLLFIAFDVLVGDCWLNVHDAEGVVKSLGLEFVDYVRVSTDIETLNYWRDMPSAQAVRNGITEEMPREGVVLRPLVEFRKNNGARIISKHKSESFRETKTPRSITDNADKMLVLTIANEIADEWVTPMRLNHVLQSVRAQVGDIGIENTGAVIAAMIEDVEREGAGEVVISKEARRQISRKTAELYKREVCQI
jgi:hypothetical protein